jgi:hypothetical protein
VAALPLLLSIILSQIFVTIKVLPQVGALKNKLMSMKIGIPLKDFVNINSVLAILLACVCSHRIYCKRINRIF